MPIRFDMNRLERSREALIHSSPPSREDTSLPSAMDHGETRGLDRLLPYYDSNDKTYSGTNGKRLHLLDFNDDNVEDLIFESIEDPLPRILFGKSDGGFTYESLVPSTTRPPYAFADMNIDGLIDIVVLENDPAGFSQIIQYQQPDGSFVSVSAELDDIPNPDRLALSDINQDGKIDVFVQDLHQLYLLTGNESGEFENQSLIIEEPEAPTFDAQSFRWYLLDVDADGADDLVHIFDEIEGASIPLTSIRIFYNEDGQLNDPTVIPILSTDVVGEIELYDINNDGYPDLVIPNAGEKGEIMVALQDEAKQFAKSISYAAPPTAIAVDFADVDGNGKEDMLILAEADNELAIYFRGETGFEERAESYELSGFELDPKAENIFHVADFDLDGRPDLGINTAQGFQLYFHRGSRNELYVPLQLNNAAFVRAHADDFSDPSSGWPIFQSTDIIYQYEAEEYRIFHLSDVVYGLASPQHFVQNYDYSIEGRQVGDRWGLYGVVLELNPDLTTFQAIVLWPDFDEYWVIGVDSEGFLILDYFGTIPLDTNQTYRFDISREYDGGLTRSVRINGQELFVPHPIGIDLEQPHFVGVLSLPWEFGFDARFDNYQVTPKE